ncbi:unnamed protein product [Pseudo-nitzschia multistriata]|uniref:Uncharacterized protein n=1 Tax=Pseudo-nitzschia multistriata TaxID=183589 RepID=A0A448Z0I7_9STRA|nr:unnamed protein product [Pseudo-nitzschia multistriata]
MITNAKLKGHGAAVLCLDLSSSSTSSSLPLSGSPLLLSGSEDGTARLWDLRDHRRRACLCIKVPGGGDVLSAVFAPPPPVAEALTSMPTPNETTAFGRDCTVYLGVENAVLEYDLRHAESPVLLSEPTKNWGEVLQNQDEVNQISLAYYNKHKSNKISGGGGSKKKKNQKKKGGSGGNKKNPQQYPSSGCLDTKDSLFLAACDDAGKIRWAESSLSSNYSNNNTVPVAACAKDSYESSSSSTILHHDNHGVAVVPACAFRPIHKTGSGVGSAILELASGGTDCKIQLWDVLRPKKPISTFFINKNANEEERSKPQVCNPPFIYSLAWSNDGTSLAAGLGDGTIGIFEINNRKLVQSQLLVGNECTDGTMHYAHGSSVASVVYPSFSVPTNDRIMCSAGSDGSIVFWDSGKTNGELWDEDTETSSCNNNKDGSEDAVEHLLPPKLLEELRREGSGTYHGSATTASHKPRILFDISHDQKINWITRAAPSNGVATECNDTIFVADTSPEITSYTIPL